ncbi:hypothetical protein BOTBODRAFT_193169 [Botryobasidium botryosum FD-172 SS1]|uniref:F-box domain-containing protein n=1 Tax=Botryobasidium botryosum (strain FD-172 SS1) TaxID=930990 RepID=A0A067LSH2_BOTB1|nr:hypothetical protein BOTBODRAFT_193169 [Botryobasidium botryosum FD-172 SS1]
MSLHSIFPCETLCLIGEFLDHTSLLHLALACRALKAIIIPRLLFRHVRLVKLQKIISFCSMLLALSPAAGATVKSLECVHRASAPSSAEILLIAQALQRMPNLLRIDIPIPFYAQTPTLLSTLSFHSRLYHLALGISDASNLDSLPQLRGLRTLHITIDSFAKVNASSALMRMNHSSPLGSVLLHSRETLESIKLDVAAFMPVGIYTSLDVVWPLVRLLDLGSLALGNWEFINLSATFPAVRHFVAPLKNKATWYRRNQSFISRLTSLEGDWKVLRAAMNAGAPLVRVVGRWRWTPEVKLEFLPPDLECLVLSVDYQNVEAFVSHAKQTPFANLKVFAINVLLDRNTHCEYAATAISVFMMHRYIIPSDQNTQLQANFGGMPWCAHLDYVLVNFKLQQTVDKTARVQCWNELVERLPLVQHIGVRIAAMLSVWETPAPGASNELSPVRAVEVANYHHMLRWT